MEEYKSAWSLSGLSNLMDTRPCTSGAWTIGPTGPVLVSNREPIATFAMCTIPKVACTNFRKLLSLLIRYPDAMPTDSFEQFQNPHIWEYPNVWHYKIPEPATISNETACGDASGSDAAACPQSAPYSARARLPAAIPSFVVGRNPYIKVLFSGAIHDVSRSLEPCLRSDIALVSAFGQSIIWKQRRLWSLGSM